MDFIKPIHLRAFPLICNLYSCRIVWHKFMIGVHEGDRAPRWHPLESGWPNVLMRSVLDWRDEHPAPETYGARAERVNDNLGAIVYQLNHEPKHTALLDEVQVWMIEQEETKDLGRCNPFSLYDARYYFGSQLAKRALFTQYQ